MNLQQLKRLEAYLLTQPKTGHLITALLLQDVRDAIEQGQADEKELRVRLLQGQPAVLLIKDGEEVLTVPVTIAETDATVPMPVIEAYDKAAGIMSEPYQVLDLGAIDVVS